MIEGKNIGGCYTELVKPPREAIFYDAHVTGYAWEVPPRGHDVIEAFQQFLILR